MAGSNNELNYQTTNHNVLVGSTSNLISNVAPGAAATVYTSNGAADGSFQAFPTSPTGSYGYWCLSTGVSNQTGDGTVYNIVYDVKRFGSGTDITKSGSTFTVNTTAYYLMPILVSVKNLTAGQNQLIARLSLTGGGGSVIESNPIGIWNNAATGGINLSTMFFLQLTATDTFSMQVQVSGGAKNAAVSGVFTATAIDRNYFGYVKIQ